MRRRDREMNRDFGESVIDHSHYGVVSVEDEEYPYSLPLSIVREENRLYFHSSKSGRKVDLFLEGTRVTAVFVGEVKVPELFSDSELHEMKRDESKAVEFISKVFTTEFESAIVRGVIRVVSDREEKIHALKLICEKYTESKMKYFDIAIDSGLDKTNVYAIEIKELTAKRKKYDDFGEEMKWGREYEDRRES